MIAALLMMLPIPADIAELREAGTLATLKACVDTQSAKMRDSGADTESILDAALAACHIVVRDYRATLNGVVEAHLRSEGVKGLGEDGIDMLADKALEARLTELRRAR